MKLLATIQDKTIPQEPKPQTREASRGVFFDDEDRIAFLYVAKHDYHKLPGGGIEEGEDRLQALKREMVEETGCDIEVTGEVGMVLEYRSEQNLLQTSYCYYGKIISKGIPKFTEKEQANGFQVTWMTLDEAIRTVENDHAKNYLGARVQKRDTAVLRETEKLLQNIFK